MSLYYIPGAILMPDGIQTDYINSADAFMLNDINYSSNHLDKSQVDGATKCNIEPCPFDGTEYIISEHRNGPVIGWVGTPRDPDEVAALKKADSDAIVLEEIGKLELLETPRRIAEAVLTDEGKIWLAQNRVAITALRAKL